MNDLLMDRRKVALKNSVKWSWLLCPFMRLSKPRSLNINNFIEWI